MTNLAGSSQANGFFGAYLKFSGYDGIIFSGKSPKLVYVVIKDGKATIHDARHLAGKDIHETERQIRSDLAANKRDVSIYAIGPAGENLVRYACITGDEGHVAGHNGLGAVMGSKNLKAVVAYRAKPNFGVFDPGLLKEKAKEMLEYAKTRAGGQYFQWGTGRKFFANPFRRSPAGQELHHEHFPRTRTHGRSISENPFQNPFETLLSMRACPRQGSDRDGRPLRGVCRRGARI